MNAKRQRNARALMADGAIGTAKTADECELDAALQLARSFEQTGRQIPSCIVMRVLRHGALWKGRTIPAAIVAAKQKRTRMRENLKLAGSEGNQ